MIDCACRSNDISTWVDVGTDYRGYIRTECKKCKRCLGHRPPDLPKRRTEKEKSEDAVTESATVEAEEYELFD